MRCNNCGNTSVFIEAQKTWDKIWYDENGDVSDAKSVTVEDVDDPPMCGDCDSTDIDKGETLRRMFIVSGGGEEAIENCQLHVQITSEGIIVDLFDPDGAEILGTWAATAQELADDHVH